MQSDGPKNMGRGEVYYRPQSGDDWRLIGYTDNRDPVRGKAEAERLIMEAPVMDWALDCLERLEVEAEQKAGAEDLRARMEVEGFGESDIDSHLLSGIMSRAQAIKFFGLGNIQNPVTAEIERLVNSLAAAAHVEGWLSRRQEDCEEAKAETQCAKADLLAAFDRLRGRV
ncbi:MULTISPECIES: hypothetical protein [unclassified Ensifer]|uniref:hypothetical protein n=1 Tax=unclassified Ensifer TaxID=2633371 RepID=UPI00081356C7|nr:MULTISPECIES: hypothetical protein [unclassified Ensifer]OCP07967.1 hypothetical protein BC362_10175 [Ensifer sp. LC14]OCP10923.1 hypothetical protein BC374_17790 [Ensifer sp. LC13]OCP11532.1 hypothetical protein BBX50_18065 [Ensifer sp. LC11]OCP33350.1 hypothetical protein BC364_16955 [Ensifer sp. LC499]